VTSEVLDKNDFLCGMTAAVPIAIGYVPIAIAYGVISVQSGIPLLQTVCMSLMVYAGASQFMAAGMVLTGSGFVEIILATFVLNFRHFIMSMSLMHSLKHIPKQWKLVLAFGITDESFAVLSMKGKQADLDLSHIYAAGVMVTAYASWVIGSLIGGIFADAIPPSISSSMSIGLYAMFIGLLVPAIRGAWRVGLIVAASMALSYVFGLFFDRGWAIVFATILAALVGVVVPEEER
jgi:4-azaleucine resistance transporter AzlC